MKATSSTLVAVDESGFSVVPPVRRTWARRGSPPVLRHKSSWPKLSAISGVTPQGGLFFQLVRGTVKGPEVISFLKAVRREVGGPVIILWDNLRTHRSVLVKQRVEEHPDVRLEYLPPCAPDLNADEGVWQWLKDEPLGNFCAGDLEGLEERIRVEKRRLKRRRDIIQGFYRRCDLL